MDDSMILDASHDTKNRARDLCSQQEKKMIQCRIENDPIVFPAMTGLNPIGFEPGIIA
jgi:hypothetical protein